MTRSRKARKKVLPNGRNKNSQKRFVRFEHELLESSAYRSLTSNARSLLIELTMIYNGSNNGFIFLSVRDAADRLGVSDVNVARNAFVDLQQAGFLIMTQNSSFDLKYSEKSRARCWRLTFHRNDMQKNKMASAEYLHYEPNPSTKDRQRMERGNKALKRYRKAQTQNKMPVLNSNTLE